MSRQRTSFPSTGDIAVMCKGVSKAYGISDRQAAEAFRSDDPVTSVARAGGFLAAHDVNFEVKKGEMFVIMGLSGSGKSTVIRMINRLNQPSGGEVIIDGESISSAPESKVRELRNRKIGMVFQHYALFPHRSVRDNAAYGLKVRGVGKAERRDRADRALERVGLGDRGDKFPHELSGGMQQRVGLARALAVDPPILLMDEPFSALDPMIRRGMQDLLLDLQAEDGRTIIFVTHDLNEAMRLGDRVMVMKTGKVIQIGTGIDIISSPANDYVREFVADVDRARILTAGDLLRPALVTFSITENPEAALMRLGNNEANGAFVLDSDQVLLGTVSDEDLVRAINRGNRDLSRALTQNFTAVTADSVVEDFIHLAGRHLVPVTVVDEEGRLAGVVPRAVILAALSNKQEANHA